MVFGPIEWDSVPKTEDSFSLWSENGEVRVHSVAHALPDKLCSRLLYRVFMGGAGSRPPKGGHASRCSQVGGLQIPAGHGGGRGLCTQPTAILNSAILQSWGVGPADSCEEHQGKASACGILWASETRLSTKEKEKRKVRLYFITQILCLLPRNYSWALLVRKGREAIRSVPASSGQLWLHLCLFLSLLT